MIVADPDSFILGQNKTPQVKQFVEDLLIETAIMDGVLTMIRYKREGKEFKANKSAVVVGKELADVELLKLFFSKRMEFYKMGPHNAWRLFNIFKRAGFIVKKENRANESLS